MSAAPCPTSEDTVSTSSAGARIEPIGHISPATDYLASKPPDQPILGPGAALPAPVVLTGTLPCKARVKTREGILDCPHRAIPGDIYCGTHGGKVVYRADGTLGYIGPGTYHAIGEMIGVRHYTVSRVLRGRVGASIDMLTRIAKAVGLGLEELLEYIRTNQHSHSSPH